MPDSIQRSADAVISLYYAKGTRATRPRWLLEEMGIPYKLIRLKLREGEHKKEPYLAINPAGKVPALLDGDATLTESLAICLHLADRLPGKGLAPELGSKARADYYRWMAYSVATLEPAIIETVRRGQLEDDEAKNAPLSPAMTKFDVAVSVLEPVFGRNPFILGANFSAADVMVGSVINWANNCDLIEDQPNIFEWLGRLTKRPAYLRAVKD